MQLLMSVPGDAIRCDWTGSIISTGAAKHLFVDNSLLSTYERLDAFLARQGIESSFVLRPELFNVAQYDRIIKSILPRLVGHVFVGPASRFKYLKGTRNIYCATPVTSLDKLIEITNDIGFNYCRLRGIVGGFGGFWLHQIPTIHSADPIVLPSTLISSNKTPALGRRAKTPTNLPVVPLFLNNHDAKDSANAMLSRSGSMESYLTAREKQGPNTPVILAVLDHGNLSTALASALRDLAVLAAMGAKFICIVAAEGLPCLDFSGLEPLAARLSESIRAAGINPTVIDSESIILLPSRLLNDSPLLRSVDYVLMFDQDSIDTDLNQLALLAGARPVFLDKLHPAVIRLLHRQGLLIRGETRLLTGCTNLGCLPFNFPQTGSLRNFIFAAAHLATAERAKNIRLASEAIEQSTSRLNDMLHIPFRERAAL